MDKMNNDVMAEQLHDWADDLTSCAAGSQQFFRVLARMRRFADNLSPPPRQVQVTVSVGREWDEDAQFVFDEVPDDERSIDTLLAAWKLMVLREFNKVVPGCAKPNLDLRPSIVEMKDGSLSMELFVDLDFTHHRGDIPAMDAVDYTFFHSGAVSGVCSSTAEKRA